MPSQRDNDDERNARIELILRERRARLEQSSKSADRAVAAPKRMAKAAHRPHHASSESARKPRRH
jgi:hypothetical protein